MNATHMKGAADPSDRGGDARRPDQESAPVDEPGDGAHSHDVGRTDGEAPSHVHVFLDGEIEALTQRIAEAADGPITIETVEEAGDWRIREPWRRLP